MGWDGNGNFSFPYNWVNEAANGVPISAPHMDTQFNDAITGFENCITRDGQGKASASVLPDTDSVYYLGSASYRWNGLWLSPTGAVSWGGATFIQGTDATSIDVKVNANGVTLLLNAAAWSALSDERTKTPFKPFDNALERVAAIKSGTGRYLADPEGVSRSFCSAQSVQSVLPEAVGEHRDELHLRYTEIIPLLCAALKEALARIKALEA